MNGSVGEKDQPLLGSLHRSRPTVRALLLLASLVTSLPAQQAQNMQMSIELELLTGSTIRSVSPQHVFTTGDRVCFRVRSSANGFLYVSNRGTSGKYTELFPGKKEAAGDNRIESGREYRIPAASRAWFRIDRPPGYETVFFTFTKTPLSGRSDSALPPVTQQPPGSRELPSGATPRCDDSLFQTRGECLDLSAGATAVSPDAAASSSNSQGAAAGQRPEGALAPSAPPGDAPIVYEFRIAHH
jgi:hypothetical protein